MKRLFGAAAVAVVGVAVGAGGMHALHAQSKLPVVTVSEITVTDKKAYDEWLPDVRKRIADSGGRLLAGGFDKTTTIIGEPPPNRVVLFQYDSVDAVKAWWKDAGDSDVKAAEKFGAKFRIYTVDTIPPK
jgi:uncharacterized protein (DUF1330 family)